MLFTRFLLQDIWGLLLDSVSSTEWEKVIFEILRPDCILRPSYANPLTPRLQRAGASAGKPHLRQGLRRAGSSYANPPTASLGEQAVFLRRIWCGVGDSVELDCEGRDKAGSFTAAEEEHHHAR